MTTQWHCVNCGYIFKTYKINLVDPTTLVELVDFIPNANPNRPKRVERYVKRI